MKASTCQTLQPEPEPNQQPREDRQRAMSARGTLVAWSKRKLKWPVQHIYTGAGEVRDPQ
jgi:hypothetical protein